MSSTRLYLLNRALEVMGDGWIHIVPKGELANREAGIVQVLDDAALDSILNNLETEKRTLGNRWPGLYAGREHFIYDEEQDSAALAWFKDFEKRADGIWAKADGLTPIGKQVIANSEYKFTSFVADRRDTQKLDGNKVRILKLDTIGFTNQANGKELLTPITNRGESSDVSSLTPEAAAARATQIANRIRSETKCDFDTAWNRVRQQEPALFNRMVAQATSATVKQKSSAPDMAQFAGMALKELATVEQRRRGGTFHDAWQIVCNRRGDLLRLSNRQMTPEAWGVLEAQAFDKFTEGRTLDPNGKLIQFVSPEVHSDYFMKSYAAIESEFPNLDPRGIFDEMKASRPHIYWPFVATTAR